MFDLVEKHKRLIQVVLVLIAVPFMFFGLEAYTRGDGNAADVATVDGTGISQREFSEELRQQQERMRRLLGPGVDASMFDNPETRRGLLDALIDQRVVDAEARRARLTVSKERIDEVIAGIPAFQKDGRFDAETAKMVLRSQNMNEDSFVERLHRDVRLQQLARSVASGAIQSREMAARLAAIEEQTREIAEAVVPAQPFQAQVKVDEEALKAHYQANLADFRTPEAIKAEYLILSADQLGAGEKATDADLKAAYDARINEFRQDEQRRASHILIQVAPDAKPEERQAARAKAESVLAEVRKAPARFAELAKKHSQDTGSAERGGDLGLFGRGMMVKPFEDAAFKLRQDEISDPVESEFGYHLIRLTGIQPGKTLSIDEVRPALAADVARQKGARRFAEAAEGFTNAVYEQSDTLQPAAEKYRLKPIVSDWIVRASADPKSVLGNAKLLAALFSQDGIKSRRNTDAIEVAPNVLVSARVVEHRPAAQRTFEEVRAGIENLLRRREAAKLAKADGEAKLARLQKGEEPGVKWGAPRGVSRRNPGGLDGPMLRAVFQLDRAKLPAYAGGMNGDEAYVLYRLVKVSDPTPETQAAKAAADRQAQALGAQQQEAYVAALRARTKIAVNAQNIEKK